MAKTNFSDGNSLLGILGTIVNSAFLNKIFNHRHDGLDQDGSAPLDYAADTGAANAYVIALTPALSAHIAGLPIHFKATNANTLASTLAINGLAAVAIKQVDNTNLPDGAIVAGQICTVVYTGAVYMLVSAGGIATTAEVQAGTNKGKAVTPSGLLGAMGALATLAGFSAVTANNGYIKFPTWFGGLIIQWGEVSFSYPAANVMQSWNMTLPIAFPNSNLITMGTLGAYGLSAKLTTELMTTAAAGGYVTDSGTGTRYVKVISIGK